MSVAVGSQSLSSAWANALVSGVDCYSYCFYYYYYRLVWWVLLVTACHLGRGPLLMLADFGSYYGKIMVMQRIIVHGHLHVGLRKHITSKPWVDVINVAPWVIFAAHASFLLLVDFDYYKRAMVMQGFIVSFSGAFTWYSQQGFVSLQRLFQVVFAQAPRSLGSFMSSLAPGMILAMHAFLMLADFGYYYGTVMVMQGIIVHGHLHVVSRKHITSRPWVDVVNLALWVILAAHALLLLQADFGYYDRGLWSCRVSLFFSGTFMWYLRKYNTSKPCFVGIHFAP